MGSHPERTRMLGVDDEPTTAINFDVSEEVAARQAEEARIRAAERAARARALGDVAIADDSDVVPEPPEKAANDRFLGSIGLFFLRLVIAAYIGVRSIQILFDISGTTEWMTEHHVPFGDLVAWGLGIILLLITAMLLIGFGTRTAAFGIAVLAITTLVFIRWGYAPVFVDGQAGFLGDTEVLVAGAALVLLFLGSGGWAADAAMRSNRAKSNQED